MLKKKKKFALFSPNILSNEKNQKRHLKNACQIIAFRSLSEAGEAMERKRFGEEITVL